MLVPKPKGGSSLLPILLIIIAGMGLFFVWSNFFKPSAEQAQIDDLKKQMSVERSTSTIVARQRDVLKFGAINLRDSEPNGQFEILAGDNLTQFGVSTKSDCWGFRLRIFNYPESGDTQSIIKTYPESGEFEVLCPPIGEEAGTIMVGGIEIQPTDLGKLARKGIWFNPGWVQLGDKNGIPITFEDVLTGRHSLYHVPGYLPDMLPEDWKDTDNIALEACTLIKSGFNRRPVDCTPGWNFGTKNFVVRGPTTDLAQKHTNFIWWWSGNSSAFEPAIGQNEQILREQLRQMQREDLLKPDE